MSLPKYDLILVDGSSYLYRAFYAMPDLSNSQGMPTGAIYGVVNMLKRLNKEYRFQYIAIVFDAKGKTFRDQLFPEYKANRARMPDELRQQIEPLHDLIETLGFPLLCVPGVEADDVIGTLAKTAQQMKLSTLIATGDKDIAQLVSSKVTLVDTMKNTFLDKQGVMDKYGVKPDQIRDYLALIGDTSDNIPGVPKVGPKTAVKWLEHYQNLQNIIKHAQEIKGKVGENLRNSLEQLDLSYQLVTIKCDVTVDEDTANHDFIAQLAKRQPQQEKLIELYRRLEFKNWLSQTQEDAKIIDGEQTDLFAQEALAEIEKHYQIIDSWEDFNLWLKKLEKAEIFAFDTETTSVHYMQAELVGLSFATEPGIAAYVPLAHEDLTYPEQLNRDEVLQRLKPLLEDNSKPKVGQNLKYDKNVLSHYDIDLQGITYDTMLESYVLDSGATRHNLDALAEKYLNYKTIHFEDIAGKGVKQLRFDQVPVDQAAEYAAEDADISLRLHQCFWPQLEKKEKLMQLYQQIELPLLYVISRIERNGVLISEQMLHQQSAELSKALLKMQQQAFELAGEEFNLSSPKQIQYILYEKMKLPIKAKTPKGAPSTSESTLQELALDHPLPKMILEYRSLAKLKTTYTDKLPQLIDEKSGRVHTSYNQAVAVTGRLSSTEPNLQNIPIRTGEGRKIRQAFIAPENKLIVAADYSQIELRIMAHLSADKGLLTAFEKGVDVHRATAAEVFSVDVEAVSDNQRRSAKAINFGLIYGMSAFGLAKQLDISRSQAQQYVDRYFQRYPEVKAYMEQKVESARDQGYVETIFGRRLYLPEIKARNAQRRQYAERTAINAPMQGSAADIIKKAMIAVDSWLLSADQASEEKQIKMIMQVHDELVFEVPKTILQSSADSIKQLMENAVTLDVPLIVDIGSGDNWEQAH